MLRRTSGLGRGAGRAEWFARPLAQGLVSHEHRGLITHVDQFPVLAEFKTEAEHNARRADPGLRFPRAEFDGVVEEGEAFEIGTVNPVAEAGPALVPSTTVKEPGV